MKFAANDFTTTLPGSWQDRTMITLVAPFAPGGFAANVVITKHLTENSAGLEDFAYEQLQIMESSLPAFELLDRRFTHINNFSAYQQLHRFETENGLLQQVQTFLMGESAIFAVTGTARAEEFDLHINAFRTIVENFQLN